jgi:hypothetical protein
VLVAASAAGSGSVIATSSLTPPTPPTITPAADPELITRATYRSLLIRGLAPDEAANLTAFLAGLTIGESRWTLPQVNQLLFLREMRRGGRFGETDSPTIH